MSHLKRLVAPRSWPIERKKTKWIAKPLAGPHTLEESMPLAVILKEILKFVRTTKEVKKILKEGQILVNNVVRKEVNFPIGFLDTLSVPTLNEYFRVLYDHKGRLTFLPIPKTESTIKPEKVIGKKIIKKGKIQINLNDGRNLLLDKCDYKVGDTILVDLTTKKVKDHYKLEAGNLVYLTAGNKKGSVGKLKEVIVRGLSEEPMVKYNLGGKDHLTLKKYAFVIGKDKTCIKLEK